MSTNLSSNETLSEVVLVDPGNSTTAPPHHVLLAEDLSALKSDLDQFFLLVMGALVVLMQAGFALIEAGTVRAKNATSILIKNISDLCFGFLAFWVCGFAFAFGDGSPVIGLNKFLAVGMEKDEFSFMFFQGTFAATCATIVSGAIAERSDYNGYVVFSVVITGFVYPIQTHWCWGPDGWLGSKAFYDFAGSGVVHLAGGICALIACLIMGPRLGRFKGRHPVPIKSHSIPLLAIGFFVLVFGFLAFNGGSQGSISNPGDGEAVALAFVSTIVAACSGGVVGLLAHKMATGFWKINPTINGALAGMISICCGADALYPWASFVSGSVGSVVYLATSRMVLRIGVDDPIDAVAVHAGAGMWGLLSGPLFRDGGIIVSGGSRESMEMLLWNAVGLAAIVLWNSVLCLLIFGSLKKVGILRVSRECEIVGLDSYKHDDEAYPEFVTPMEYNTTTNTNNKFFRAVSAAAKPGAATLVAPVDISPSPPPADGFLGGRVFRKVVERY